MSIPDRLKNRVGSYFNRDKIKNVGEWTKDKLSKGIHAIREYFNKNNLQLFEEDLLSFAEEVYEKNEFIKDTEKIVSAIRQTHLYQAIANVLQFKIKP